MLQISVQAVKIFADVTRKWLFIIHISDGYRQTSRNLALQKPATRLVPVVVYNIHILEDTIFVKKLQKKCFEDFSDAFIGSNVPTYISARVHLNSCDFDNGRNMTV